jgi:hypothetical protein
MKPWPARSDIFSSECRLARSILESRASFAQARSTLRTRLTKPSSLLVVTGAGALFGVWLARRTKARSGQDTVSARVPILGPVSTLLTRFGLQLLTETWTRLRHPDSVTK